MNRPNGSLKADALLLLTAIIWGLAFVAQRVGMDHLGPYAFNALRYAIGALVLLPIVFMRRSRRASAVGASAAADTSGPSWKARAGGIALVGAVLFSASSLQQIGLVSTTAGNAGFITCLYVVLVPLIGFFFGTASGWKIWVGAALSLCGLYILSVTSGFRMQRGDLFVLAGSFLWAAHILVINRLTRFMDSFELSFGQFAVCSLLSLAVAVVAEPRPFAGALAAAIPLLYGGVLSCGLAFTLQVVAQKTAHPAHAAIILSMEALFAGVGGVLILGEALTARLAVGGGLMLAGAILSQLESSEESPEKKSAQSRPA